jgi:hypothetical protein
LKVVVQRFSESAQGESADGTSVTVEQGD